MFICNLLKFLFCHRGPLGSTYIDREFFAFLNTVFGKKLMSKFRKRWPLEMIKFREEFNLRKQDTDPVDPKDRRIALPTVFVKFVQQQAGLSVKDMIKMSSFSQLASLAPNGDLRLSNALMMSFFKPVVDGIIEKLMDIPELKQCQTMFLVGGFGRSNVLRYICLFFVICAICFVCCMI
jgi:hypothetical protein